MFESLRQLVSDFSDGGKSAAHFGEDDYRLAAAALLVHDAGIDGEMPRAERDRLRSVVKQRFDLDDDSAEELIAEATEVERQSVDLYRFTARLNRSLDERGRARIVEMLWQIAFADGVVTEFEDNLIWRVADLLGISRNERIALRQRVTGADKTA